MGDTDTWQLMLQEANRLNQLGSKQYQAGEYDQALESLQRSLAKSAGSPALYL
ncbi:hypothetical protein [Parathermosynechococcus lividus]